MRVVLKGELIVRENLHISTQVLNITAFEGLQLIFIRSVLLPNKLQFTHPGAKGTDIFTRLDALACHI